MIADKIESVINEKFRGIDLIDAFDDSATANETLLIDLATSQLDEGKDQEGDDLGTYQNVAYKGRLRPVDLKDTGAFRKSFNLRASAGRLTMGATDEKTAALQFKYGIDILGLPVPKWEQVKAILKTDFIVSLRNQMDI